VTTLEIDPRIEARRDEVRRQTGRRRFRVLVIVAVVVLSVVGTYLTIESPFLDVDHVDVSGAVHVSPAAVQRAAAVAHGRPLLRVNLAAVAARVDQLPWVAHATVRRSLPGTLRISVTEATPVAYVRSHGIVALLARDDRVIARTRTVPAGVVEIIGARRAPQLHELLSPAGTAAIVTATPTSLRPHLRAIALRSNTVALVLDHGEIRLGTVSQLRPKLAAAAAVFAQYHGAPFDYIDVTDYTDPVAKP
jgi:cell division protein FtsQ